MEKRTEEIIKEAIAAGTGKVYLHTETKVEMNKKENPLYGLNVTRRTRGEYDFNKSYEASVNEALLAEGKSGEFKAKSLPWGHWYEGAENKIIEHTNAAGDTNYYLRYYMNNDYEVEGEFFVDGNPATAEQIELIEKFSKKKSGGSKLQQEAGVTQEKEVRPLLVNLNNVIEIEFRN